MQLKKNGYGTINWPLALAALSTLLLLAGCESGHGQQAPPAQVPEVATVTIQPQQIELSTELPGRTSPYLVAEIRPQVNGIIQKRQFREGSDVQAGQLLFDQRAPVGAAGVEGGEAVLAGQLAPLADLGLLRLLGQDREIQRLGHGLLVQSSQIEHV